jgi:peptidoglycan-associated lipoprotein
MHRHARIVCMLAIGTAVLLGAGCSNKAVKSGGETATSAPREQAPYIAESDLPSGAERVAPVIAAAKVDPAERKRQQEEAKVEQTATAAAGLRDVFFGYDSWTISEEGRQALARDAEWLRAHRQAQLKVEGHCDERGSSGYNFILAEKRAKAVRNYLLELGITKDRVTIVSYGKERPFCRERSESCYQQNRRGHLVVKP